MHIATLVITPGSRGSSYARADRLLFKAANDGFDYSRLPGIWGEVLRDLELLPTDDPWPYAIPTSRLPAPIPTELVPAALVTPRGAFLWKPIEEAEARAWERRVNRLIDKYRGGHTIVLLDAHC